MQSVGGVEAGADRNGMGFVFVDVAGIVVCGLGCRRVGLPGDGHGGVFTTPAFEPNVAPVIVFIPIRFGQFVACHAERRTKTALYKKCGLFFVMF